MTRFSWRRFVDIGLKTRVKLNENTQFQNYKYFNKISPKTLIINVL
jgi:hypothetical protein